MTNIQSFHLDAVTASTPLKREDVGHTSLAARFQDRGNKMKLKGVEIPEAQIKRMFARAKRVGTCLIYQGRTDKDGYGVIVKRVAGKAMYFRTNRVAWSYYHNDIPDGKKICHTCGTPPCIEGAHLYPGTDKQNAEDRIRHGRNYCGTAHHSCKLTESKVRAVYKMRKSGMTYAEITKRVGIAASAIAKIATGKSWKHLGLIPITRQSVGEGGAG